MHPILARPARLAAYIAIWLPIGVLLATFLALQGALTWTMAVATALPLSIGFGFLCLSAWYVTGGSPVDRVGPLRIGVTASASAFLSSAMWLLIARAWLGVLGSFGRPDAPAAFRVAAPTLFGFGVLLYLLAIAVSYLGTAFTASRDAERRGLELQVLAREAELRALRTQLDPHFLFNSLQSISALTTVDPAAARRMCLLLADFLRETLALGARERITVVDELALVRRFLAVEQVRFGDRLRVEIHSNGADDCLVPPLLLQPLVENAVTHGIAHVLDGGAVRIDAHAGIAMLSLTVENPSDPDRPSGRGTGLGLSNVRERLERAYGDDAHLTSAEREGRFVARIEMPVERHATDPAKDRSKEGKELPA